MSKRQVFHSFHYSNDSWRAAQVRNIGAIESNSPVSSNDWEEVKRKGDSSIEKWINDHMNYRSCLIVLIGEKTSTRKWCNYEIQHAWEEGKGIVGIYIHNLKDSSENQSTQGSNPFDSFCIDTTFNYIKKHKTPADANEVNLSEVCKAYNPPYSRSTNVYNNIKNNIEAWVEEAIEIRNNYPK